MKYLYCHACNRGYDPLAWTPAPTADPEWAHHEVPLRHRECPRGHTFQDPESWQTEVQYQQDRERERKMAAMGA